MDTGRVQSSEFILWSHDSKHDKPTKIALTEPLLASPTPLLVKEAAEGVARELGGAGKCDGEGLVSSDIVSWPIRTRWVS